jgi:energy-coupling factor transporter ATP-binding protein EcfA2
MESKQLIEIKESLIQEKIAQVDKYLLKPVNLRTQSSKSPASFSASAIGGGLRQFTESFTLADTLHALTPELPILTDVQHHALTVMLRGMAIASATASQFDQPSGLNELLSKNSKGLLHGNDVTEFHALLHTNAAIVACVFCNYVQAHLEVGSDAATFDFTPPALALKTPADTMNDVIAHLASAIKEHAHNDDRLFALIHSMCNAFQDQIDLISADLKKVHLFTRCTYQVKKDHFEINGFERSLAPKTQRLSMAFKKPEEVIGNAVAKYQAAKLAKMMMCYDFERKLNPFAELGGFIFTFMGDGNPGTGKTTLIQMLAGLLNDYCQQVDYPFYYENFGPDCISSYQGESGQNAKSFIRNVLNPSVIGFGTIDDIDQVAGKRGDKQSSSGQQEVTAVLMESFAGANTLVRGNCSFGMFSNYPENVDDALRQRAAARFLIDGPKTYEDYVDILALLLGKRHTIPTGDIELFTTQAIQQAVKASYEAHAKPQEAKLLEVYERVIHQHGELDTLANIGYYLKAIQQADDRFTGRAIKNITDAAKVRSMDFELPDEWFEHPDLFLFKPYDTKRAMIEELSVPITPDMLLQEINRYADSEFRYAGKSDDVVIQNMVRELGLKEQALSHYQHSRGHHAHDQ